MSDPFESLNVPDRRVTPDPGFRAHLMDELGRAFDDDATALLTSPTAEADVVEVARIPSMAGRRRPRALTLVTVAAALIVALGSVVMLRHRWTDLSPSNGPVTTAPTVTEPEASADSTTPPTTSPPTTTTVPYDPVRDAVLAESMLLTAEEYAPNVSQVAFKDVVLDRAIAEDVPGCSAFLDAVFESPDRPAVTRWRSFYSPLPAVVSEYVIVLPSDQAAHEMFDAMADPTFTDGCAHPYHDLLVERNGDYCCDVAVPGPPPMLGHPVESAETFGADDVGLRVSDQYYTDGSGVHGPDTFEEGTVRVGRAIVIIEAITKDELGNPVITEDQFHAAITTTVTKARGALAGQA